MSLEMQNENELVMESMVPTGNVVSEKKVSKSLTMNEKRAMYGILSFLVIANRDGILDDGKTQELMEHLPIFGTISEKKAFLSQEMFDMQMIEKDILKPMLVEHNAKKKQEKKEEKKQEKKSKKEKESEGVVPKEVKPKEPKKKRASKKEKVVEEDHEVPKEEKVVEEEPKKETKKRAPKEAKKKEKVVEAELEKDQKKRGRKAKQQIVECNTEVNVNAGNSQEDQLADLVNQLTGSSSVLELKHPDPEEIDLADLDEVLSNLEEEPSRVMTPRLPETEVEVEKKGKGKEPKKKATKTSKK